MRISLRAFLQRVVTYPTLFPIMLLYALVENKGVVLNAFYLLRGLPHGYLKGQLRIASYDNFKIMFPFDEDPAFDDVWLRNVYQSYIPRKDHIVIDVGAHMGFFTLKIARNVKKVIAVEPDPVNLKFLAYNLHLNKIEDKVISCNCALGEKNGEVFLDRSAYGHGRSKITSAETGYSADIQVLDRLIKEKNLETVNLIKIDTEGFEVAVLKGAVKTLQEYKPDVLVAAYHFPQQHVLVANFLREHGYSVFYYYIPLFLSPGKEIYLYAKSKK